MSDSNLAVESSGSAEPRLPKSPRKAATASLVGSVVEYYDFFIYGVAAALVFPHVFFPDSDPKVATVQSFATFGVGYVARPLGAVVLGHYGDRIGRKNVLVFTLILMGASTISVGLIPSHRQIGIWAPILLVALRLIQGFGAGAEIAGATVMLAEFASARRRGLISSLVCLGTNSGTLGASALWAILAASLSQEDLLSWGWRIPFLASFVIMLFAVWIRRSIKESPVFEQRADVVDGVALTKDRIKTAAKAPELAGTSTIEAALHQKKGKSFLIALGLRFGQAGNSGLVQTFLVGYLATVLLTDKTVGTNAIMYGSLLGFVTIPVVGLLGDRFGRRPLYLALSALTAVYAIPMMLMITSGNTALITIAMVVGLNLGVLSLFAMESVTMAEFFGARTRFTQLALAKEIGGILATAIGPLLAATLTAVTGHWWPLAAMLIGYSLITLVSAAVGPEVRGRDLVRLEDAV